MQLKIRDSHYLTGKVAKGYLSVRERMEVVESNKVFPSLLLLSREKNPDRKTKTKQNKTKLQINFLFDLQIKKQSQKSDINKKDMIYFVNHLKYGKLKHFYNQ